MNAKGYQAESGGEELLSVIHQAVEEKASDIHFGSETGFAFRVQGELTRFPKTDENCGSEGKDSTSFMQQSNPTRALLKALMSILSHDNGQPYLQENMGVVAVLKDCISRLDDTEFLQEDVEEMMRLEEYGSWRISLYRSDGHNIGLAMRHLPQQVPSLNSLISQRFDQELNAIKEVIQRGRGLILVTGVTGSGKTTTLAAMVDYLNQAKAQFIVTLEDPVEYRHTSKKSVIHHRHVGRDVPSYQAGLKSALRQDPDTILLGELRDLETMQLALTAAETGHLVMATLHSHDVESTITRFIDVFPPSQQTMVRTLLASSLQCVISQQLIPTDNVESKGGRLLVPEIAVLPDKKGSIRATILDGRYHQISQVLATMGKESGGFYVSSTNFRERLKQESFM